MVFFKYNATYGYLVPLEDAFKNLGYSIENLKNMAKQSNLNFAGDLELMGYYDMELFSSIGYIKFKIPGSDVDYCVTRLAEDENEQVSELTGIKKDLVILGVYLGSINTPSYSSKHDREIEKELDTPADLIFGNLRQNVTRQELDQNIDALCESKIWGKLIDKTRDDLVYAGDTWHNNLFFTHWDCRCCS